MEHERITNVRIRNGRITHVKLDDGREMRMSDAIQMALTGEHFLDYIVGYSKDNVAHMRSLPDQDITNNLQDLPEF